MASAPLWRDQISGSYVRPLLLVDVDGVISLFGFDFTTPPAGRWELVDGIPHLLSATAGDHLRRLAASFELVWCTGWEEKAGAYLPAWLEVSPDIPYLSFDEAPRTEAHWKLAAIDAYAGPDRPLAWIDDALDEHCRAWARRRPAPTLLIQTASAIGITAAHVTRLAGWAAELRTHFKAQSKAP